MNDQFLKQAMKEAGKLEEKLAENPDFRRWKAVTDLIREWTKAATPESQPAPVQAKPTVVLPVAQAERSGGKAPAIIAAAVAHLRGIGRRMNSTTLAEALIAQGIEIAGKNKAGTLSAYLSAAKEQIDNVRGEGYGLKEWSLPNTTTAGDSQSPAVPEFSSAPRETVDPRREAQTPKKGGGSWPASSRWEH